MSVTDIEIRRLQGEVEPEICARMMAASEPWITLRRDLDVSLGMIIVRGHSEILLRKTVGATVEFKKT